MPTTPYLTVEDFKTAARIPASWVDEVEAKSPGYTAKRIEIASARLDGRLRKRYAAPFASGDVPTIVIGWLVALVTADVLIRRGVNPTDAQMSEHFKAADQAETESTEAANAVTGLYDLPLRADGTTGSGISIGGVMGYSEQSPYVSNEIQRRVGQSEDDNGCGSS